MTPAPIDSRLRCDEDACGGSRSAAAISRRRGWRRWAAPVAAVVALATATTASQSLAAPDLVVESLTADPDSGPNGTAVEVRVKVRNQGDAAAAASVTRIRINTDPASVLSSDPQLCNIATSPLSAGSSVEVGCTPSLGGRPPGANYIWAILDVNNDAGQTDRSNDRRSELFTVNNNAADLVVQSIDAQPQTIPNGAKLQLSIVIKNQGTLQALSSVTRVRINLNPSSTSSEDTQLCNITTPTIAVGGIATLKCDATINARPPGTNYLWVLADVNNTAGQIDRNNDRASSTITVAPESADLFIETMTLDPTQGGNGDRVEVTATIRNKGTAASLASTTRVRINQDPLNVDGNAQSICGSIDTPAIPIGGSAEVSCSPTLEDRPEGTNYIWVIADAANSAGQADRSNDRKAAEFIVDPPPTPDMSVRTLTVNPTSGQNGSQPTITARIGNDGEVASPVTRTTFIVNQNPETVEDGNTVLCDAVNTVALSAGASVNISCKPTLAGLPSGVNYIWAIADATGLSGETNHANNRMKVTFTVATSPAPDLVVEAVSADPASAGKGSSVAVLATIRNQGSTAAAASVARVRLGADSAAVHETDPIVCNAVPTPAIVAGGAIQVGCNWLVGDQAPGAMFLWVTADADGTAGQLNRSNDSRKLAFTVLPPDGPDLIVKRVTVVTDPARNGDSLTVKARIENIGNQASAESATTFRINVNPNDVTNADELLCGGRPTPAIPVGESVSVKCTAAISDRPLGTNYVWAVADVTASSGQSNFGNDKKRGMMTVLSADCTDPELEPLMAWPIEQPRLLQDYATYGSVPQSSNRLAYHSGIDLLSQLPIAPELTPVYAAADGEVISTRRSCPSPADAIENPPNGVCGGGWGNYVVIRHGAGIYSVYAHLGEVFARKGCVEQGQRIAIAGSSGSTTIPVHLHFDVLAGIVEPFARGALGYEYYRRSHPFFGHRPENEDGAPQTHVDARDYMPRARLRLTEAAVASRGDVSGGAEAFLAKGQEYVSYGELVPGYFLIDLPYSTLPQDGDPYSDGPRYGWVEASKVDVLENDLMPGSVRVSGLAVYAVEGVGANFVSMNDQASESSALVARAWGDQQFAPSGNAVAEVGSGRLWRPVYVPGSTASGAGMPRTAYLPVDLLDERPAP